MSTPESKFRVQHNNRAFGPMTREQLIELLDAGRLDRSDLVCEGKGPWTSISELLGDEPQADAAEPLPANEVPMAPAVPQDEDVPTPVSEPQADSAAAAVPVIPTASPSAPAAGSAPSASLPTSPVILLLLALAFLVVSLLGTYLIVSAIRPSSTPYVSTVAPSAAPVGPASPVPGAPPEGTTDSPNLAPAPRENAAPTEGESQRHAPVSDPRSNQAAVAMVCVLEKEEGTYIPYLTAGVVDRRHLVTHAFRLLKVNAERLIDQGLLHAVTQDRAYEVVAMTYHAKFPAERIRAGQTTEQDFEAMILNDLALLTVGADLPSSLTIAEDPGLQQVGSTPTSVQLLSVRTVPDTAPRTFRPRIEPIPARLLFHSLAPRGDRAFCAIEAQFRLHMDGSPVLNSAGALLGLTTLNINDRGLVAGNHQVLSAKRIREIMAQP